LLSAVFGVSVLLSELAGLAAGASLMAASSVRSIDSDAAAAGVARGWALLPSLPSWSLSESSICSSCAALGVAMAAAHCAVGDEEQRVVPHAQAR